MFLALKSHENIENDQIKTFLISILIPILQLDFIYRNFNMNFISKLIPYFFLEFLKGNQNYDLPDYLKILKEIQETFYPSKF